MFACDDEEYLGYLISGEGVKTDPRKTAAMQQWPVPEDVKALRGFLGLIGYYRKFIKGYGQIAAPLTALLKKNFFVWSDVATQAFHHLKLAIPNPPMLALPYFSKTFTVECDASGFGLGTVLMQDQKHIAFYGQVLKGRSLTLFTYEKEFLAVVVVQKWRHYLVGKPFVIKTDQQSLKYLLDQRVGTLAQRRQITKLLGYNFLVEYKKGKENVVADALSRQGEESMDVPTSDLFSVEGANLYPTEGTLFIISFPTPTWIQDLKASYETDQFVQNLLLAFHQLEHCQRVFLIRMDLYCIRVRFSWGHNVGLNPLFYKMNMMVL